MPNNKRIVIIEGDAFDADAIVAIVRVFNSPSFRVVMPTDSESGGKYSATFADAKERDAGMFKAIDAWRKAVGDLPMVGDVPAPDVLLPDHPPEKPIVIVRYWSDEKGRYYESYGGSTVYFDPALGNFIWNEGPPRRKNPLGPEASPIVKVYIGQDGKPLDPQPI